MRPAPCGTGSNRAIKTYAPRERLVNVRVVRPPADFELDSNYRRPDFKSPDTPRRPWSLRKKLAEDARKSRLERDRARGYSINTKQVVLAFAVEFVIKRNVRSRPNCGSIVIPSSGCLKAERSQRGIDEKKSGATY